ncbi:MAG TPA: hypothetical protein VN513_15760 [Gemmatimonadales bacterium]|nr:hypothetical protein [Gemmatimonadales bacterium]
MSSEVADTESRLTDGWIRPALGSDVNVEVGSPTDSAPADNTSVTLTLMDIAPAPPARTADGIPPLKLRARYLVTVAAKSAMAARQALADLAFSAAPSEDVELLPTAPGPELWQSLGVRARPAVVVSVLFQRERQTRPVARVRHPLITRWAPSRALAGVVLGPGNVPIAGALVEVEGLSQSTYSNHRGEFAFGSVPAGEPSPTLVIRAKGTRVRVRIASQAAESAPIVIRVPVPES